LDNVVECSPKLILVSRTGIVPYNTGALCVAQEPVRAWEQQALQRTPIPDEVLATLMLKSGDVASSIWELYNNLEKNGRLVRVGRLLLDLAEIELPL
jgi:hypothetical protein